MKWLTVEKVLEIHERSLSESGWIRDWIMWKAPARSRDRTRRPGHRPDRPPGEPS